MVFVDSATIESTIAGDVPHFVSRPVVPVPVTPLAAGAWLTQLLPLHVHTSPVVRLVSVPFVTVVPEPEVAATSERSARDQTSCPWLDVNLLEPLKPA